MGNYVGEYYRGLLRGDTRSLDYGPFGAYIGFKGVCRVPKSGQGLSIAIRDVDLDARF